MFADRVLRDGLLTGLLGGLLDGLPSGLLQRKKYCAMVMMRRSVGSPDGKSTGLFSRPPHGAAGFILSPLSFSFAERVERSYRWIVLQRMKMGTVTF